MPNSIDFYKGIFFDWEQLGVIACYIKDSQAVKKLFEYETCDDIIGRSVANLLIQR